MGEGKVAKSPRDKITQKTKSPTVMKKDKITHLEITQGQDHSKDQITQKTKSPTAMQKDKITHLKITLGQDHPKDQSAELCPQ